MGNPWKDKTTEELLKEVNEAPERNQSEQEVIEEEADMGYPQDED